MWALQVGKISIFPPRRCNICNQPRRAIGCFATGDGGGRYFRPLRLLAMSVSCISRELGLTFREPSALCRRRGAVEVPATGTYGVIMTSWKRQVKEPWGDGLDPLKSHRPLLQWTCIISCFSRANSGSWDVISSNDKPPHTHAAHHTAHTAPPRATHNIRWQWDSPP